MKYALIILLIFWSFIEAKAVDFEPRLNQAQVTEIANLIFSTRPYSNLTYRYYENITFNPDVGYWGTILYKDKNKDGKKTRFLIIRDSDAHFLFRTGKQMLNANMKGNNRSGNNRSGNNRSGNNRSGNNKFKALSFPSLPATLRAKIKKISNSK